MQTKDIQFLHVQFYASACVNNPCSSITDFYDEMKRLKGHKKCSLVSLPRFGKICEVAYLALRKKANFLITLFMMMMNTGIPEISTIKDIKYLQVHILFLV